MSTTASPATSQTDDLEPEPEELELEDTPQMKVPEHHMSDEEVELGEFTYSDRMPTDFVVSGPLGDNTIGPGRHFDSMVSATRWARKFYGRRLLSRVDYATKFGGNRWAFLIRPTRAK